jgi:glycosyltransferase involved in cell wall biosynthesis
LGISGDAPVGIFAGSMSRVKNFELVRSLMSAMPGVRWILAIRGEVANAGFPSAVIQQDVGHDQLPALYNAADFSVCPSFYEAFGYVVAESLACGTPVIASRGGASSAFLQGPVFGQFLIEDPSSVTQFASAAREILRDRESYRQKVMETIRPRLVEMMGAEKWWPRFLAAAGL